VPGGSEKAPVAPTPHHQVLLVEDNDDLRDAYATWLRVNGFDVAPAWGVEDAYRELREGFRPCTILLDLQMPGMDGWAFLDRARLEPHLHDVPIIIVSARMGEVDRARDRGCEFLLKPVDPAALIAAIGRHCRRHTTSSVP